MNEESLLVTGLDSTLDADLDAERILYQVGVVSRGPIPDQAVPRGDRDLGSRGVHPAGGEALRERRKRA